MQLFIALSTCYQTLTLKIQLMSLIRNNLTSFISAIKDKIETDIITTFTTTTNTTKLHCLAETQDNPYKIRCLIHARQEPAIECPASHFVFLKQTDFSLRIFIAYYK